MKLQFLDEYDSEKNESDYALTKQKRTIYPERLTENKKPANSNLTCIVNKKRKLI